jgi:hypothetical protein
VATLRVITCESGPFSTAVPFSASARRILRSTVMGLAQLAPPAREKNGLRSRGSLSPSAADVSGGLERRRPRDLQLAAALPTGSRVPTEGTAMTHEKMPPVPKENRSPKGTGSDPDPKHDKPKSKEPKNVDQTGERANIRQNTSNVQDKR